MLTVRVKIYYRKESLFRVVLCVIFCKETEFHPENILDRLLEIFFSFPKT